MQDDDAEDWRAQRLFVAHDLGEGRLIPLAREQANYALKVLRLRAGASLRVFNGRHGEWSTSLALAGRRDAVLEVHRQLREQAGGPDIDYLFAPLKRTRLDYLVQKATEMGVARLRPVITRHTIAERINLERMRANVVEAAEQCGILRLPEVVAPVRLAPLLDTWDPRRRIVFCDEAAGQADPIGALQAVPAGPLALLIGPEGGFASEERARLLALPFTVRLALGPRVMRADTAAVAALALVNAVLGDWRPAPAKA